MYYKDPSLLIAYTPGEAINLEVNVWIGYALQTSRNIPHKVMAEDLSVKTVSSNHNPFLIFTVYDCCV